MKSHLTEIARYELGQPGVDWVRRSLGEGWRLSELVLEKIALDAGHAYAFLPTGIGSSELTDFEDGLFHGSGEAVSQGRDQTFGEFVSLGGSLLVVEDNIASPGDPYVQKRSGYSFAWDDHVYYWHAIDETPETASQAYAILKKAGTGYPTNSFTVVNRHDRFAPSRRWAIQG